MSGSMLVFSDEIDHWQHGHLFHVTPQAQRLPLQTLLQKAQQAVSGSPYIYFLRMPQQPGESLVMRAEYTADHKVYIYLNPYTGQVLHIRRNTGYFTGWLLYLHFSLLSGKTGAQIILVIGCLFFISLLTGIWIYRKSISKVLAFRLKPEWHNRKRRWRNLHRIIGVWALLFNLLIVITGVLIELKVVAARKKLLPVAFTGAAAIPYDRLLAKAQEQLPQLTVMGIRVPQKAGDPVRYLGHTGGGALLGEYSSSVNFDAATGAVQKTVDIRNAAFSQRFDAAIAPLHFGNYGGIPVKIIYCLFALAPGLLSVSGFLIWYRRKYIIRTHRFTSPSLRGAGRGREAERDEAIS